LTHYFQARILRLQGFAEQALRVVDRNIEEGTPSERPCPFAASWAKGHARSPFGQAGDARFLPRFLLLLGELAACLGQVGEMAPGLAIVEDTLARSEARDQDLVYRRVAPPQR
jgi:hypothetical protein